MELSGKRELSRYQRVEDGTVDGSRINAMQELFRRNNAHLTWEEMVDIAPVMRSTYPSLYLVERVSDFLLDNRFKTVVDAGCGDGFEVVFHAKTFRDKRFFAFDPALNARAAVEKKANDHRVATRVRFFTAGHAEAAALMGEHFAADALYSNCSIIGVDASDPGLGTDMASAAWQAYLKEAPGVAPLRVAFGGFRQLLKPRGQALVITTFDRPREDELYVQIANHYGFKLQTMDRIGQEEERSQTFAFIFIAQ